MIYRREIEQTETGFSAYSPDVPGVGVAGDTRDETLALLDEAIAFHFEDEEFTPSILGIVPLAATDNAMFQISFGANVSGTVSLDTFANFGGSHRVVQAEAHDDLQHA